MRREEITGMYPLMSVCYCASLRAAARKATALYDARLAPAGLNIAQFALLRKIERAQSVSLTELGRLAALDRSTVGRNVKVLERIGLVRISAADDHREAAVTLTSAGAETLAQGAFCGREPRVIRQCVPHEGAVQETQRTIRG